MGLFGKLLGKESAPSKEADETPKAEAAEVKSSKETGKERVDKMLEAAKAAKNAVMGKTGNILGRVGYAMRDAFFATIGGIENAEKTAVKGTVEAGKAAAQYARETKTEAGQIVSAGIEAGNQLDADVDAFLKTNATKGVDALNHFGNWVLQAEKELKEKAPGVHADIKSRLEKGAQDVGDAIGSAVMEGLNKFNAFTNWVRDAKTEFAQKRGEVHQNILDRASARIEPYAQAAGRFAEHVLNVPRDLTREFGTLTLKTGAAKDRFVGSINDARLKAAGTAELKGEVEALREQVARLTRMVEARSQLARVVPEAPHMTGAETSDSHNETLVPAKEDMDAGEVTEKTVKA